VPYEKDGRYYDRNTDPDYISWLKVFRKLQNDGYLPSDVFVDQRIQITEKVAQGRYFCMIYQRTDIAEQQAARYAEDPNSVYIAVDGPRNSRGDDPVLPLSGLKGWMISMIPKSCSHPDLAIKLFSYLLSEEGQKLIYLGVEGEAYEESEDGHINVFTEADQLRRFQKRKYNSVYGGDDTFWMLMDNVIQLQWAYPLEEPVRQTTEWTYPYAAYTSQYDVTMPENSDLSRMEDQQESLWGRTLRELLLAKSDDAFDSILESYREERLKLGYDRLMEAKTEQMIKNKVTMGVE
jgi:putative aldouronate transport system substrate-binding protein